VEPQKDELRRAAEVVAASATQQVRYSSNLENVILYSLCFVTDDPGKWTAAVFCIVDRAA
jgi:hypothetical protein